MTDWDAHKFGPGYDICARCLGEKEDIRRWEKWCLPCGRAMTPAAWRELKAPGSSTSRFRKALPEAAPVTTRFVEPRPKKKKKRKKK